MPKKVKTAVEKAMEQELDVAHPTADPPNETLNAERKEYEVDDFKITPQEKPDSHVINQDEATGFDENKKSGRFKDDKQAFSRIKDVRAEGPEVVIEVEEDVVDLNVHAAQLKTQRVTPSEAVQRALALNSLLMVDKINLADRKQVQDIVEATILATMEAQENIMRANGATYEDIKAARRARLEKIEMFEAAVVEKKGKKALDKLQEMTVFKKVLQKLNK